MHEKNQQETASDNVETAASSVLSTIAKIDPVYSVKGFSTEVEDFVQRCFNSFCENESGFNDTNIAFVKAYFNTPLLYPPIEEIGYPHMNEANKDINLPPLVIDDFERFKIYCLSDKTVLLDSVLQDSYKRLGMFSYFTRDPKEIKAYMDQIVDLFRNIPLYNINTAFHHFRMNPILQGELAQKCMCKLEQLEEKYKVSNEYKFIYKTLQKRIKNEGVGGC